MKIEIIRKTEAKIDDIEVQNVISFVLSVFNLTDNREVEILFMDKEEITALNRKFRKLSKPTDVLSFPQQQIPGKENILGSIVICPEIVKEKGENYLDVIKHGLLHLLGYDHETAEKEWERAAQKINCNY